MRDKLKEKDYFSKCIEYENARIIKFTQALQSVDKNNLIGIRNANLYLSNFYRNLFKLKYSAGYPINEIFNDYLNWLNHYKLICSENDSFYDLVDMFSIGVLYSNNREGFILYLTDIIEKCKITDGLILLFYDYVKGNRYTFTQSKAYYFENLFFAEDKHSVISRVLSDWYKNHKDAYWYDSHKSKNNTYCGYWCFEIAAFVKIFKLDASSYCKENHYPYDFFLDR